jgi:hypothetical protein
MHRWTCLFNTCRAQLLPGSNTHKQFFSDLFYFLGYSGKAEPQCQATPVEFGSPHDVIVRGLCRYMFTTYSVLLIYKPNSWRVTRVGRVRLAQEHTQACQTPPSTWCVLYGQRAKLDLGPRQNKSPWPIYSVDCLSIRASWGIVGRAHRLQLVGYRYML